MLKYLALGPGGTGYFALLGVLQHLADKGKLTNIKEIAGASAGSIAAMLYILFKGNTKEMFNESMSSNISQSSKPKLSSFIKNYGFIPTQEVTNELEKLIKIKLKDYNNLTFAELFKYNPVKLHIASFSLSESKTRYFSVDTDPDMIVTDAICASIAVPFLFASVNIQDSIYIDGGMEESVPMLPFLHQKQEEVMGVKLKFKSAKGGKITDIRGFAGRLVDSMLKSRLNYDYMDILTVDMEEQDPLNFKLSDHAKIELFIKGYLIS